MAFALGLGDQLLGVSHECDYPAQARSKPVMVRNALPVEAMTQAEIDVAVTERLRAGQSLYVVDEAAMSAAAPDLVITQNLCEVCAPAGNEVAELFKILPSRPDVLWMSPKSIEGIFDNIIALGDATGRRQEADRLAADGRERLSRVRAVTERIARQPRVFCMEWMDPVYCSGHWVPEMVQAAGGIDRLGRLGTDSVRIPWDEVLTWAPEAMIIMPCGFNLKTAVAEAEMLASYPGWEDLPAVRDGRVYVVDANAYFARPGPRIVDGVELLAHLFHPDFCNWSGPPAAYHRLDTSPALASLRSPASNAAAALEVG